ncbi:antitoxin [Allostella vacuolata]|nr:antitoxin [Stella vacuolata]
MREVGAVEAQDTLDQLLDLVERGEQVVITRHGRPVARLVPEKPARDVAPARAAADRIIADAKARKSGRFDREEFPPVGPICGG